MVKGGGGKGGGGDGEGALKVKDGGVGKAQHGAAGGGGGGDGRPAFKDPVPDGWIGCPPMGKPLDGMVPIKVPLGSAFDRYLEPGRRFRPSDAVRMLQEQGLEPGLVIDLTNSYRYYRPEEWSSLGVDHIKIPCRGRGETPDELSVNHFVWEVTKFQGLEKQAGRPMPRFILVHCTHGHNRTGFMIAHYLIRSMSVIKVKHAIGKFAAHRPPGIYKEEYVQTLYDYYHERREPQMVCPGTPEWKKGPEEEDGDDAIVKPKEDGGEGGAGGADGGGGDDNANMTHEDVIGEEVPEEYAELLRNTCYMGVMGHMGAHAATRFPGSQPVSLERANMGLLKERLYWVTWKADGTRYMVLLMRDGVYLIDRSFHVRRVQMIFPKSFDPRKGTSGGPHHLTLMDGEMVVDEDMSTGIKVRRFLVYDLMMLNERSVVSEPFGRRFEMIHKHVTSPKSHMKVHPEWAKFIKFEKEPFSVRRKDFWMLSQAKKLLEDFIPNQLLHESDGLIFQGYEDPYVPDTCQELLKWKYAHMNSVDFRVRMEGGEVRLYLMDARRGGGPFDVALAEVSGDASYKVMFPGGEDPAIYEGMVVEFAWNKENQAWSCMRTRPDKDTPNHRRVYHRVLQSIKDDITEQVILDYVEEVTKEERYQKHQAEVTRGGGKPA